MSKIDPLWNEMQEAGARTLRPHLAARVLAETARQRASAALVREKVRIMATACFAVSLLVLAYTEFNAQEVAPARIAEWNQVADWVHNFDIN